MDISSNSALGLTERLRNGSITAVDVMEATYDRIEAWNPSVNAIVLLMDRDTALDLARASDAGDDRGPLHGLPFAVKDLANAQGFITSMGSPLFATSAPAASDDILVARLREAGALIIGKTNTPEFGLGSHTTNPVHGATNNPWGLGRSAGGSSGGAAVALATGMLPLADGSDMMGSLRNPAGWNGVYGLRPTLGAVPSEPSGDTFFRQLSTSGPMARSPDDLGLLMTVIAGPDPRQPHGIELPDARPKREYRIGWLGDWNGVYPLDAGIMDCCEEALRVFADLGHDVADFVPDFSTDAMWSSWTTLRSWQIASELTAIEDVMNDRSQFGTSALWELERGQKLSALDVHKASVIRSQWYACASEIFERYDFLALPTAQCWPFNVTLDWPKDIAGKTMDTYHRWMEIVVPASLIGLPALAIPAGFGTEGLPMGLQLIGPPGADYTLLSLGQSYHERAPWTGLEPPLVTKSEG